MKQGEDRPGEGFWQDGRRSALTAGGFMPQAAGRSVCGQGALRGCGSYLQSHKMHDAGPEHGGNVGGATTESSSARHCCKCAPSHAPTN